MIFPVKRKLVRLGGLYFYICTNQDEMALCTKTVVLQFFAVGQET